MPPRKPRGVEASTAVENAKCRTWGHAWDQYFPTGWEPPAYGWRMSLRCTRCGTERHDLVAGVSGQLLGRRYEWQEGYLLEKGDERPTRDALRAEMFARLKAQLASHNAVGNVTDENETKTNARKSRQPVGAQ